MSQWPSFCDIGHLMRFSQVPPIYQLFNDLPSSMTDENGKIPYAGNAWCIIEICEMY